MAFAAVVMACEAVSNFMKNLDADDDHPQHHHILQRKQITDGGEL